jgi:proteic killer suppression protein
MRSSCRERCGKPLNFQTVGQPLVVGVSLREVCIPRELTVNRLTGNLAAMPIQSFSCPDTEGLFTTGRCRRFVNIKSVAERKLAQLDAAPSVNFMKAPPGNDLKEYDGAWHVRINDQWRLTFKWGDSGPYDVLIEDPH